VNDVQLLNKLYFYINLKTGLVLTKNQFGNLKVRLTRLLTDQAVTTDNLESVLEGNQSLFESLLEEILINESYFFRNEDHFRVLRDIIFPVIIDKNIFQKDKRIRALSVGCSTGQEPLSILISFAESNHTREKIDFHIDAIDLSRKAILTALAAEYTRIQCRGLSSEHKEKYFLKTRGEKLKPTAAFLEKISYFHGNILSHELYEGCYDIIFARNTLIYFDDVNSERVKQKLIRAMKPGGYLFLGESEIGWGLGEKVQSMKFNQSIIYRKR